MKPNNTNRFRSAIIAIVAVALLAIIVLLVLRYAAPESSVTDDLTPNSSESTQESGTSSSESGEEDDLEQNTAPVNKETQIAIENFAYQPSLITVEKGSTITWTNEDSEAHTVTVASGEGPKSELLAQGESYSYTFNKTGTFEYFCEPHPYMEGTVTVVD